MREQAASSGELAAESEKTSRARPGRKRWEEFKSRQQPGPVVCRSLEPAGLIPQRMQVGALVTAPIIKVKAGPSSSRSSRSASTSSKASPSETPSETPAQRDEDGDAASVIEEDCWDDLRSPMAMQKLKQALLHSCSFADAGAEDAAEDGTGNPLGYRQRGCPRRLSPVTELGTGINVSPPTSGDGDCPPLSPSFSPTGTGRSGPSSRRSSLFGEDLFLPEDLLGPVESLPTSPTSRSGRLSPQLHPAGMDGAGPGSAGTVTPPELSRIQSTESLCSLAPASPRDARSPRDSRCSAIM